VAARTDARDRWLRSRAYNLAPLGCVICDRPGGRPLNVLVELSASWVTADPRACLPGYVCVVSRRHVDEPYLLDDGGVWLAECMLVARALGTELRPKKMNYEIHGNTIPHLHLFPRFENDPFVGRPIDGAARSFERSPEDLERIRMAIVTAADQGR
jgi:diadenosine tetraphosphate (Ap4A) HIT family hydrolase